MKSIGEISDAELETLIAKSQRVSLSEEVYRKKKIEIVMQYVSFVPCYHCGWPTVQPYMCQNPRCKNPGDPDGCEEREQLENLLREKRRRKDTGFYLGAGI